MSTVGMRVDAMPGPRFGFCCNTGGGLLRHVGGGFLLQGGGGVDTTRGKAFCESLSLRTCSLPSHFCSSLSCAR